MTTCNLLIESHLAWLSASQYEYREKNECFHIFFLIFKKVKATILKRWRREKPGIYFVRLYNNICGGSIREHASEYRVDEIYIFDV